MSEIIILYATNIAIGIMLLYTLIENTDLTKRHEKAQDKILDLTTNRSKITDDLTELLREVLRSRIKLENIESYPDIAVETYESGCRYKAGKTRDAFNSLVKEIMRHKKETDTKFLVKTPLHLVHDDESVLMRVNGAWI